MDAGKRNIMEILIKIINEDDFQSLRTFMKLHSLDKFILTTQFLESTHIAIRKMTINGGVESMINFLSSVSDSIPDKLFYLVDVVVDATSNGYVIIGDVRLSGSFIFQMLLKDKNMMVNCKESHNSINAIREVNSASTSLMSLKETIIESTRRGTLHCVDRFSNVTNEVRETDLSGTKRKRLTNDWINISKILNVSKKLTLNCDGLINIYTDLNVFCTDLHNSLIQYMLC